MIRYAYNAQKEPPAPFLLVTLRNPYSGAELSDVPAQLDTGADQSLVPFAMVQALALLHTGEVEVAGVGGNFEFMKRYGVSIAIHTFPARLVEVLSHPGEPWILLGRDVLNHHRIVLDGPRLAMELG